MVERIETKGKKTGDGAAHEWGLILVFGKKEDGREWKEGVGWIN